MLKKIVTALYAGFVVFCIINLFSGSVGIVNLKSMKYFKGNLKQHVEELEIKNSKLEDEIVRLSSEHDRLVVASRPLGYIESGQKMIKILNNSIKKKLYDIDYQYIIPVFKQNTNVLLLVSALFTIVLFVILLLIGVLRDTFKRE